MFFVFSLNLMRIYLEIGSRSKDIGYSLTLETVSWIIQHPKHHFPLNFRKSSSNFSRITSISHFHISKFSRKQPWDIFYPENNLGLYFIYIENSRGPYQNFWGISVKIKLSSKWAQTQFLAQIHNWLINSTIFFSFSFVFICWSSTDQ